MRIYVHEYYYKPFLANGSVSEVECIVIDKQWLTILIYNMVNIHTSLILITTHLYFYGVKFKLYYNSIFMLKRQNEVNYSFFNGISIYTHFFLQCIMPIIINQAPITSDMKLKNSLTQPLNH